MPNPNVVVIGSGMAGLGAAYRLHTEGVVPVMYDKSDYHGGHTASFRFESGFLFDMGLTFLLPRTLAFRTCSRTASTSNTKRSKST